MRPYEMMQRDVNPNAMARRDVGRLALAVVAGGGDTTTAMGYVEGKNWDDTGVMRHLKSAIGAHSTGVAPALTDPVQVSFARLTRERSLLAALVAAGALRVPEQVTLHPPGDVAAAAWVAEGGATPVAALVTGEPSAMRAAHVSTILVVSKELTRAATQLENYLADRLSEGISRAIDQALLDPAGVGGAAPASITSIAAGATHIASTGPDSDAIAADLATALQAIIDAGGSIDSTILAMNPRTAVALAARVDPLGQPSFPGITARGGLWFGLPVQVSSGVPFSSAGTSIIAIDASGLQIADGDQSLITASSAATVEAQTIPTGNSTVPSATEVVSLWQTNSIGVKADRWVNWRAAAGRVAVITGVQP